MSELFIFLCLFVELLFVVKITVLCQVGTDLSPFYLFTLVWAVNYKTLMLSQISDGELLALKSLFLLYLESPMLCFDLVFVICFLFCIICSSCSQAESDYKG